jgi:HEAT repeat protein/beta-lactamase regulating signal transducer with metallopeptidase domain
MKLLETLLAQPWVMALGWALLHFLWQGTVVALLLAATLRALRARSTNARYAAACVALLLMAMLPLATMALINPTTPSEVASGLSPDLAAQPAPQPLSVGVEPLHTSVQAASETALSQSWQFIRAAQLAPLLPWLILLWLLGVIGFSLRLIGGWLYTRRLRQQGTRPLAEKWQQVLRRLCQQLRVSRSVQLLESTLVKVPTAIGWLRPVILLPASALAGLPPQQLEAIIAHELAHIRRHDYLINLLQAVIETLLFYHPAVWWVSRRIRQEREHCCDDLAVAVCGDALTYARALLEMEQLRAATPQLVMAANGGLLMNRIQRLVGVHAPPSNRFTGLVAGLIALTTVICLGVGAQILLPAAQADNTDQQLVSARKINPGAETTSVASRAETGQPARPAQDERAAEALLTALQNRSWEVRKAAVEHLAQLRGSRTVELLLAALKDEHRQVREQAVVALRNRADEHLIEHLTAALMDNDWQVREQAAIALGTRTDNARVTEALLKTLSDSEWPVREQSARSLGVVGREQSVEPLINALRDQHEQVREAAAKSLGIIGDRRAVEPLTQALQDASEQVRKKAIEALGLLKQRNDEQGAPNQAINQQTVTESLNALSSANPTERAAAACSLGRLGAVEAIPALINLLGDDTPVQPLKCWGNGDWGPANHSFKQASPGEQAAIALASLGQPAVNPLIAALSYANPSVRRNAAWAIGELRGSRERDRSAAVEPLLISLRDAEPWVRVAAAYALGELRPQRATDALILALGDTEWIVREMAAWSLGEMKARAGVESLTARLLEDENERVRRKAAWALGEIRDAQALEALTAALNDRDQRVRATAKWAIAEIRD